MDNSNEKQQTTSDIGPVAKKEIEILNFWNQNKIFEKTLDKDSPKGDFVFYDGPPFATGLPHYGHMVPGTIKDVIPRYKTMQGYHVDRRWGWDCHGLPIENMIQKENDLKTSQDIEAFGIKEFNKKAKDSVFKFDKEWKEIIPRTGRWVDMTNPYTTMDSEFTESVWWGFGELYKKGLVYEDFKVMHLSPLLETTLSNFEVNQDYRDIKDLSATAKFKLKDEPNTFVLAWTTTPWTLPANVALAVGKDIDYVKVEYSEQGTGKSEKYIVAKELVEKVFVGKEGYKVVDEFKGSTLVGKSYKPPFDYYINNPDLENRENGWKIYDADFVNAEDGTGIAHEAPPFGEEDYQLLKEHNLPFVQHVNINGTIKEDVTDFAGLQAKPKEDPMATDIEVIKKLAGLNLLFSKEKITHSYPHCWRTGAPLLNYATSSWFIKVSKIKSDLIKNNEKVNWVPENVGKLRFGNWLKEARDWAISRSRYWGTPIPIWRSTDGKDIKVISSLDELKEKTKFKNNFYTLRHGESSHNVDFVASDANDVPSHLTEKGKMEVIRAMSDLKSKNIDFVYVSPLFRTQETAEIVKRALDLRGDQIITDDRISEVKTGFNGQSIEKYRSYYKDHYEKFDNKANDGENLYELKRRVGDFLYDIESKNENKNILIISHEYPIWMLMSVAESLSKKDTVDLKNSDDDLIKTGEVMSLNCFALPHDDNYELDLHRPFIDQVVFKEDGKKYKRITEVFDGWIDSGSMPFASNYYPKKKDKFKPGNIFLKSKGFPADFIAEGLDQTRGWFYTLLVLGTTLFGKSPYKNVVVNGLVLAEDGKKMSKSLNNYSPIEETLDKFGADSVRYYLMNSGVVRGDDLKFIDKGVDDVMKKIILRLDNVVSFYELYKIEEGEKQAGKSDNVLDIWILERLNEVINTTTESLENYELDKAARPFTDFVDDLSTWYVRRSRDRFKDNDNNAKQTLKFVLLEFAKVMAPFMPFKAEDIHQRIMKNEKGKESVHLESWPKKQKVNQKALDEMKELREVVTLSLEKRASTGLKVRQPLSKLTLKNLNLSNDLIEILKDEVNVKEVASDSNQTEEVVLDTEITPELKEEGNARELIRAIQDLRKKQKLAVEDAILVHIQYGSELESTIKNFGEMIRETTKSQDLVKMPELGGEEVVVNESKVRIVIQKN